jgi:transposase
MRIIGLDIHRAFAEAVAWDDGKLKRLGRVDMRRPLLEAFAKKLLKNDVVVVEATGNASSVAAVIAPHVKKVVIANPKQVRIIAHAKIKTDTLDAGVLAGGRGRQTLDDNSGRRHGGGAHHLGGDRRG